MEADVYLVAGLGNPGENYARTRHNIGFMAIDRLAEQNSIVLGKKKFEAVYGLGQLAGKKIILAKPMSFMNNSGYPLVKLSQYYKIESRKMVIIHDDIDLAFETIKIKMKGGHAGHKGIRSTIDAFGDNVFTRIRVGIGHPGVKDGVVGHVLGKFSKEEFEHLDQLIDRAGETAQTVLEKGGNEAMALLHKP